MSRDKDQSKSSEQSPAAETTRLPAGWLGESEDPYEHSDPVAADELIETHGQDDSRSFDSMLAPVPAAVLDEREVEQRKSRRGLRRALLIGGSVVLVAALGFFGFMGLDAFQGHQKAQEVERVQKQQEVEKAKAIKESDRPFSVLIGKTNPPSEEPLKTVVANDELKVGGSVLSFKGGKLTTPVNGCELKAITDICLGARGSLGDNGDFDVLAVKDISRTRILDNPSEFTELKESGGTIAASLAIDMGAKEGPSRFGALTASGTTGFVLIFPEGTSASRVEAVLKAATVI